MIAKTTLTCQQENQQSLQKYELCRPQAKDISLRKTMYGTGASNRQLLSYGKQCDRTGRSLSHQAQALCNYLLERIHASRHGHVDISRGELMAKFGYSERHITRITNELELMGFVTVRQYFDDYNRYSVGWAIPIGMIRQPNVGWLHALRRFIVHIPLTVVPLFLQVQNSVPCQTKINIRNVASFHEEDSAGFRFKKEIKSTNDHAKKAWSSTMQAQSPPAIPVLEISSLELTPYGVAELVPFPQQALACADGSLVKRLRAGGAVASPFGYLIQAAKRWCQDHNVQPEYHKTAELVRLHRIDTTKPKFTAIKIGKEEPKKGMEHTVYDVRAHQATLAPFYDEQEAWTQMSLPERKEYLRPMINSLCERNIATWAQRYCPFMESTELIEQLIAEWKYQREFTTEEIDMWLPLVPHLAKLSPDKVEEQLRNRGMERHISLVHTLIANHKKGVS